RVAWLKSDAGPASASAFDDALSALDDFEHMDLRARDDARNRQSLQASDLIFTAGLDLTRKMSDALERARTAEVSGRDSVRAALQRREAFSLGAAAAAATLIVLLLMPSRRPARPIEAAAQVPTASSTSLPADDTSLALDSFDALDADESWKPEATMPADPTTGVKPAPAPAVALQADALDDSDRGRLVEPEYVPVLHDR